ncbi:hypothetical protein VNO78_20286 [Psophocarpus tetragonolobus]|uniref:Uncharacterized protein n=1 Tax=Psophocarpus tetragonolobus TaxID=3891 RepID=A0AAN9SD39_PSOTE
MQRRSLSLLSANSSVAIPNSQSIFLSYSVAVSYVIAFLALEPRQLARSHAMSPLLAVRLYPFCGLSGVWSTLSFAGTFKADVWRDILCFETIKTQWKGKPEVEGVKGKIKGEKEVEVLKEVLVCLNWGLMPMVDTVVCVRSSKQSLHKVKVTF